MAYKSIEVYYDIATIPNISNRNAFSPEALKFRNRAMEHIQVALLNVNAGEWEGAEVGSGEVNFGFAVDDQDRAEQVVRESVKGTEFDCIREIQRREMTDEQIAENEAWAAANPQPKPMNLFELIGILAFKRVPKRFREQLGVE